MRRLFFDISYTRTQQRTVGITRTVHRLMQELSSTDLDGSYGFVPVVFHSEGYREIRGVDAKVSSPKRNPQRYSSAILRMATSKVGRALIEQLLRLPWVLIKNAWNWSTTKAYDELSKDAQPVVFQPEDLLLLCDASWNYCAWGAVEKARQQGAKVAFVVYDLMAIRNPEYCFSLVPPTFKTWLHHMLACCDAAICISKATEDDLRKYAQSEKIGLPPIGHFRLGSDPVNEQATESSEVLRSFLQDGLPCFVAVGSIEPKKNYGFLLEVFEGMWARGVNVKLLIVGRETAECSELTRKLRQHTQQGVRLLTLFDATDAEVMYSYENSRALILTSSAEGFGLPLVEARTRGCLVIASALPAFIELADEGVSIYAPGSHAGLEALITAHAEAGFKQRTKMAPFLWNDSALQCRQLCEKLLSHRDA
jgi:glycosyltransferase involved in cell wall biosynthesis